MSQYKYYFRKPKSEMVKDILNGLIITGLVCVAATSPYFVDNLMKQIKRQFKRRKYQKKKNFYSAFYRLRKGGFLNFEKKNHQIYISLTEKGRKAAGRFQVDDLKITVPKKWDKKWRLVIFDIVHLQRLKRDAFRSKLRELGFYPLQKSIWAHPFPCRNETNLLRSFFGLGQKEIRLITAENIEDDRFLRKIFNL